jgi:hypothetical protein
MNRSERKLRIKKEVYASKGGPCPYDPDTMEGKHWERVRRHYWNMEAHFDDLAQVYGEWREEKLHPAAK